MDDICPDGPDALPPHIRSDPSDPIFREYMIARAKAERSEAIRHFFGWIGRSLWRGVIGLWKLLSRQAGGKSGDVGLSRGEKR